MDKLFLINTILVGCLFSIWTRKDFFNALIKMALLGLLIADVLRLAGKL